MVWCRPGGFVVVWRKVQQRFRMFRGGLVQGSGGSRCGAGQVRLKLAQGWAGADW